jgi:arginyl-tRNA synthetase
VFDVRKKISAAAEKILTKKYGQSTVIHFDVSMEQGRGDLTTSAALQLAKKVGSSPRDVATVLADAFKGVEGVDSVEIAGPGFVNVTLTADALISGFTQSRKACLPSKKRKEQPVIVEYSQPNIAKPLGIHHIIGTVLGQAVSNLYEHQGYPVIRWNYIGDWGTQFGKLAVAKEKWAKDKKTSSMTLDELLALYVKFHEELKNDATLEDQGRAASLKLEQGDKELRAFWKDVVKVTKATLAELYRRLHVEFDLDLGESFYEDKTQAIVDLGKKKGVFKEGKEGALIAEFPEATKMPPYVIVRGDGGTLYSTRDIAQMRYRIDEYKPQKILIFTDIAQKLHFEQLIETCKQLGWELPEFENVLFGRMRFADRSMSTRKGNILKLEDALDEAVSRADTLIESRGDKIQTDDPKGLAEMIGVGSLVYGILSQNRKMDMVFDWDKMLTFEGNSAPYVQYTHARACSVLRKAESAVSEKATVSSLTEKERVLVKLLLNFDQTLHDARSEHLPHKLTNYLYDLCQAFNSFYNSDEILSAPKDVRDFRLLLTSLTAQVIKTGAEILTLRVPERM